MSEIRYVRISESFVAEFCGLVAQGASVVLLGPRNIGKHLPNPPLRRLPGAHGGRPCGAGLVPIRRSRRR